MGAERPAYVTELSDLLELADGAGDSFRSVRATVRLWQHTARFERAMERHAASSRGGIALMSFSDEESDEPPPEDSESLQRLWWERPMRFRQEDGEGVTVSDGITVWRYVPGFGTIVHERAADGNGGEGTFGDEVIFEPAAMLAELSLEPLERTVAAGREAIHVRATPRAGESEWSGFWGFTPGADEYDLLIDAERGVLLRVEARLENEPVGITELLEVAFDEELPEEIFRFEPPPGEPVRTSAELAADDSFGFVTSDEAARRASFPVWVPDRVEPHLELQVTYSAAHPDWPGVEQVHVSLISLQDDASISIDQQPAGVWVALGASWERVEHRGQQLLVREASSSLETTRVRLERQGTAIEVQGRAIDRARLLELAATLVRASREPPRIR